MVTWANVPSESIITVMTNNNNGRSCLQTHRDVSIKLVTVPQKQQGSVPLNHLLLNLPTSSAVCNLQPATQFISEPFFFTFPCIWNTVSRHHIRIICKTWCVDWCCSVVSMTYRPLTQPRMFDCMKTRLSYRTMVSISEHREWRVQ